ncbi:MAG: hypothetical protein IJT18_04245 [Oscillospiraceae bacterium]|nr:hypothetical protein [Oscillospiraceae bacterium]
MIQSIRQYFLALTSACLLIAVVCAILPNGAGKRVLTLAAGVIILLVTVQPILHADWQSMLRQITFPEASVPAMSLAHENDALTREIISERCRTYILDKAKRDGVALRDAAVTVSEDGGFSLPSGAVLRGQFTEKQKSEMSGWIRDALGVGIEAQTWLWE